ncbi:gamma-glutamyl-gamma-aminobutyrate hydrolase family protein [Parapedobacter koreensis]|uniref:Putative glutamine amidotransferase n=1 Tax=Parapedobacter koreensis TaxID=332977 RepID=A0A1H7RE80_9SPHI|nr:gamma-glutamyl-gamma-aminobutyrate hydrolase family protein [Parapedobacter koreensis]SEL58379.1 putative glutamine amidotransferase [Parapedobacter koreensis]
MSKLTIGMTDGRMYAGYAEWVAGVRDDVVIMPLSYTRDNLMDVNRCHGVVFTGGEDVHPSRYGKPEFLEYCVPADFDERRDEFELELMHQVQAKQLPVLGICRGLQLANVYFGGTLIPDIPTWGKFNHAKLPGGGERDHAIRVDPHSLLFAITGHKDGWVNSLHHQSADRIGEGLAAAALSDDGIVEALERKETGMDPFLLLVQWHPERMDDARNPFMGAIRERFINEVKNHIIAYENH